MFKWTIPKHYGDFRILDRIGLLIQYAKQENKSTKFVDSVINMQSKSNKSGTHTHARTHKQTKKKQAKNYRELLFFSFCLHSSWRCYCCDTE